MSFPEPTSFNGGPDETGGYIGRGTGRRREPEARPSRPGPARCHHCASTIVTVFSLSGIGMFCSDDCRQRAKRHAEGKVG